ncbi:MAG: hypothetical protein AB1468_01565 [Candidatus Micrarchaeota archaeon]
MKREYVIGILVIILIAIVYISASTKKIINREEAEKFVSDDLRVSYPDADVREIVSSEKSGDFWNVKARVTFGLSSPCPRRIHVYYNDYPRFGFIQREENITKDCMICVGEMSCNIIYEEEAIIASHTFEGTEEVHAYTTNYNARGSAEFYPSYRDSGGESYSDVWVVEWKADAQPYDFVVVLGKSQTERKALKVIKNYKS